MKKIIIIIIFFIFSCENIGNNYKWSDDFGNQFIRNFGLRGYDYGWGVANSPFDNGIIVAGSQEKILGGDRNLWLIKTDPRGIIDWEKSIGGSSNDEGYNVISTSDGGFLVVGYTWSYGNEQQIYLVKTDFHGNIEWEKNYGGAMWEVGYSAIEINGGGYAVVGFSNSPGISSGNTDVLLLKLDNSGNQIWMKAYGNKEYPNHEWGYDFVQLDDDSFIIVGARDRYDYRKKNALIMRVDGEGNILWEKEIISENYEEISYGIAKSLDSKYYISMGFNSKNNLIKYKPKILKIDSLGGIIWERRFESNSREYHQFNLTSTQNGNIILAGTSYNNLSIGKKSDAFLTKIDSNGNIIWTNSYGTADEDDWGWNVVEKNNGEIIMVGSTKSYNASLFDIFLIGLDSRGFGN